MEESERANGEKSIRSIMKITAMSSVGSILLRSLEKYAEGFQKPSNQKMYLYALASVCEQGASIHWFSSSVVEGCPRVINSPNFRAVFEPRKPNRLPWLFEEGPRIDLRMMHSMGLNRACCRHVSKLTKDCLPRLPLKSEVDKGHPKWSIRSAPGTTLIPLCPTVSIQLLSLQGSGQP